MLRMPLLVATLVATLAAQAADAGGALTGRWAGELSRDGAALDAEFEFVPEGAGYGGRFSSAQLRATGIPLARVTYEPPQVRWSLIGDATTLVFEGTLRGDAIDGRFKEGDTQGSFRLLRRESGSPSIEEREISFRNGPVELAGTVLMPPGIGPFPGVAFLHGSGAEQRFASRFLAGACATRGIAALIFDKRGTGASKGDWRQVGFEELIGDAAAAVEALRAQAGIDPARVGIHGHSQGGTIAPWVAADNPNVAFVVGSAASGVSMAEAELFNLGNTVGLQNLSDAERPLAERYIRAVVDTAYHGVDRSELESSWQAVRGRPWVFEPPPESASYWAFSRRVAAHRPLDHWRRVNVPALLVYGEADQRVPARQSAALISDAYLGSRGTRLDVILFAGADHGFRLRPGDSGKPQWPVNAPGYPDAVIDWILRTTQPP